MRGAAFLSGLRDAIVVDVGGTTTDVGVLKNGFPREASSQRKVMMMMMKYLECLCHLEGLFALYLGVNIKFCHRVIFF